MEPYSVGYTGRLAALRVLRDKGCKTWVSVEPYSTPNLVNQQLADLLMAIVFADRIIFGRTNYSKEVTAYPGQKEFYNQCAAEVVEFCQARNKAFHIKDGTITTE